MGKEDIEQRVSYHFCLQKIYSIGQVDKWECVENILQQEVHTESRNLPKINPKEDVAFLLQSSGTTGMPKGVTITHFAMVSGSIMWRFKTSGFLQNVLFFLSKWETIEPLLI